MAASSASPRAALAPALYCIERKLRNRLREIGHAEAGIAKVKLAILGYELIGFIDVELLADRLFGNDIAEARMLIEVPAEGVTAVQRNLVTGRDP